MSQNYVGLFDTPPDHRHIRIGFAIVGLLILGSFATFPVRGIPLPEIGAFVPVIDAIMLVGELITATLLYAQAGVFRSRALTVLATGYVYSALLLIPHALTFPGAFAPDGWLGAGVNTTAWSVYFRRLGFPIAILFYVHLKQADSVAQAGSEWSATRIGMWILGAFGAAAAVTLLTTVGHDLLPSYFRNRSDLIYSTALWYHSTMLIVFVAAAGWLFRNRSSVLDTWLLVALAAWAIETLLTMTLEGRFTVGWYSMFVMTMFSHLVVMLALIAESHRLYARLALATAAQSRDRDNRLMSLEAVAAVISHEIGQPLTAAMLNTKAGLNSLTKASPDVDKATRALEATLEAGNHTFNAIKSIKSMFTDVPRTGAEFCLNDLVRATSDLLDREMASRKISLDLDLDETLPPIVANRVQLQRVLVNLFTNAIEALEAVRRRRRRIAIRTVRGNDGNVLFEISDNGSGATPEDLERMFDTFYTTKATGTGLGLPLCHIIVREHAGRLWASRNEEQGATFHLQLPHILPQAPPA